jgi:hypothetical protein
VSAIAVDDDALIVAGSFEQTLASADCVLVTAVRRASKGPLTEATGGGCSILPWLLPEFRAARRDLTQSIACSGRYPVRLGDRSVR